jgi:hypothetical protein
VRMVAKVSVPVSNRFTSLFIFSLSPFDFGYEKSRPFLNDFGKLI